MKNYISNLVELSRKIGAQLDFVQGGGGNISVKIADDLMAIKASGYELKNLHEEDGFAFVNHEAIAKKVAKLCEGKGEGDAKNSTKAHSSASIFHDIANDEEDFAAAIKLFSTNVAGYPTLRPSMETGFHSLIPFKYVVHTHSVYGNVLACAKEGFAIMQKLFPESLFVSYSNPGWQVTAAIFKAWQDNYAAQKDNQDEQNNEEVAPKNLQKNSPNKSKNSWPQIILLQNHGLIIAANDAEEVFSLHEKVNEKIKSHLKLASFEPSKIKLFEQNFMRENILFPDQIVYGLFAEIAESEIGLHTFLAYSYILQALEQAALTPLFLQQKDVDFVANMESEKYRREVAKK